MTYQCNVQLQEDIRKNEFVAEYTGELIDHCEADRRGKAYDRDSNTYLFDLNDEWVIDAKQRGNKMRFANHRYETFVLASGHVAVPALGESDRQAF